MADGERSAFGRRALLGKLGLAAAGGAGIAVAGAVLGTSPAAAANGDPVLLGDSNSATSVTAVVYEASSGIPGGAAIWGDTNATGATGVSGTSSTGSGVYGVQGEPSGIPARFGVTSAGVWGDSSLGYGLMGSSSASVGVRGVSSTGVGISGDSATNAGCSGSSGSGAGVYGESAAGNGVWGVSGATAYGVYGVSALGTGVRGESSGYGVSGYTDVGYGVHGGASDGIGVYGTTEAAGKSGVEGVDTSSGAGGFGVQGSSAAGIGVFATSASGTALGVEGVATFSRSGTAVVAGTSRTPRRDVTVTGVTLSASSLVLATPQGKVRGVAVEGVVTDLTASSFTIHLTDAVHVSLPIAWFIIG